LLLIQSQKNNMDGSDIFSVLFVLGALFVAPIAAVVLLFAGDALGAAIFGGMFVLVVLALAAVGP